MSKAEMYPNAPPPPYPETGVDPGYNPHQPSHQQYPVLDHQAPPLGQSQMQYSGSHVITQSSQGHPHGTQVFVGQAGAMVPPTVTVVTIASLGPYPIQMQCTKCRADIITSTKATAGLLTWLLTAGLCLFGCWLFCCLIPFCVEGCQDVEHFCPNCRAHIGTFKRI